MRVEDVIHVDAPRDTVWAVTVDVERWPEWTPTVSSVARLDDGPFRPGSVARIDQPAQPVAEWTVTELVDGRRFAWETRRTGLRMTGTHEVVPDGDGATSVLGLEADGFLARLLGPLLRIAVRRALAAENRGLKARCEEIARTTPVDPAG